MEGAPEELVEAEASTGSRAQEAQSALQEIVSDCETRQVADRGTEYLHSFSGPPCSLNNELAASPYRTCST